MSIVEIEMDATALVATFGRLIGEMDTTMAQAVELSLDIVAADARTRAPISPGSSADGESAAQEATGFLRRSIGAGDVEGTFSAGGLVGVVSASAPYALHVEYGTKPHEIRPKANRASFGPNQSGYNSQNTKPGKRALRWPGGAGGAGGWAFAKVVKHPGTAAKPFLRPALTANRDAIINRFSVATRLAIARAKAGA